MLQSGRSSSGANCKNIKGEGADVAYFETQFSLTILNSDY